MRLVVSGKARQTEWCQAKRGRQSGVRQSEADRVVAGRVAADRMVAGRARQTE